MIDDHLDQVGVLMLPAGFNAHGETVYSAPVTVPKCRVQHQEELITSDTGEGIVSTTQVWLLPTQAAAVNAKFVFAGKVFTVQKVYLGQAPDNQLAYKKLYLGG